MDNHIRKILSLILLFICLSISINIYNTQQKESKESINTIGPLNKCTELKEIHCTTMDILKLEIDTCNSIALQDVVDLESYNSICK